MRVSELLQDAQFSNLELLAGASGVENKILTVTVVDTPDGAQWLKGGEMVITTGFMLENDEDRLLDFISLLSRRRVVALGIKRNRHISHIPDSALALADSLGFPLIAIPESYAFADIINPVLSRIIDRQHLELTQSNIIHSRFLDMAVNDRPIYDILETLSLIIGIPSAFLDTYFDEIYYSDPHNSLSRQLADLHPRDITAEYREHFDCHPVANQNAVFGYLLFPKDSLQTGNNYSLVAVGQAAIVIILRMQVRISNKYIHDGYKSAFVVDMLLNNIKGEKEIHNRAQLYNWDFHHGGMVAVLDVNNLKKQFTQKLDSDKNRKLEGTVKEIFDLAILEFEKTFRSAKYMRQSDLIAFLITVPPSERDALDDRLAQVFARIQSRLESFTSFTISIGVGDYYGNIKDIHKSYSEARTTINLSYTLQWFDRILFYKELGLYRMLLPMQDFPEAREYYERYLKPLEVYDTENGQDLLMTLHEIIQSGWNLKKAAENMYLHYNSMKYRYSRICAIVGLDLSQQMNRLMISIILIVHMISISQLPDTRQYLNQ